MFTQKCFIRKNTLELVKRLEELGYKASFSARNGYGEYLYAFNGIVVGGEYNAYDERSGFIDCKESEELFIAIASLRNDTDNGQWQVADGEDPHNFRKMTVQELIEHFNK